MTNSEMKTNDEMIVTYFKVLLIFPLSNWEKSCYNRRLDMSLEWTGSERYDRITSTVTQKLVCLSLFYWYLYHFRPTSPVGQYVIYTDTLRSSKTCISKQQAILL